MKSDTNTIESREAPRGAIESGEGGSDLSEDTRGATRPSWCGPTCTWCEGNGTCEVVR